MCAVPNKLSGYICFYIIRTYLIRFLLGFKIVKSLQSILNAADVTLTTTRLHSNYWKGLGQTIFYKLFDHSF